MRILYVVLALALAVSASPALADPAASPSPAASSLPAPVALAQSRIDTMLRTGHADASWFSASFLAQVPVSKVDEIVGGLTAALGAYQSVEFTPAAFVAHFARGTDNVLIHLDGDNKIDGLLFRPPSTSMEDGLRALRAVGANLSYVITEEGRPDRAAFNDSERLAVGSAFKLAVLNALQDEVRSGKRHWSDVVPLEKRWKSLPTGVLLNWPNATPLTLANYAAEMISISDNTAADALIDMLGQPAIARYADGNEPFLTTREMFILKSRAVDAKQREAYLQATTPQERSAVLARIDSRDLPEVEQLLSDPVLGIEWHYSVRQLCTLMSRVAQLPTMSINPGLADRASFAHVAYKGGSDVGVLNLTTMVTTKRGSTICFSATVNDASHSIDETSFESAYASVLQSLAGF